MERNGTNLPFFMLINTSGQSGEASYQVGSLTRLVTISSNIQPQGEKTTNIFVER
jgi:hypothetical protein